MNKRNTKQREIILDILNHHRNHPTIQELYSYAKEKYPNIGQATIYRNINNLVDEGEILKIPHINKDSYHYDINTTPHEHLLCKSCGKIIDLFDNNYNKIIKKIEKNNSIEIDKVIVLFEGICESCKK